jgi:PurA ssDNA and RNA-binding protein
MIIFLAKASLSFFKKSCIKDGSGTIVLLFQQKKFYFPFLFQVSLISRGTRSQIGIPAQGIARLRDAFTELIDEFGSQEEPQEERGDI